MCRTWLKYVTPLVASATAADGRFSVDLSQTNVPLEDPAAGTVSGWLEIESARIGAGPLSEQFLLLANQVKAVIRRDRNANVGVSASQWLELPPQRI